MIEYYLFLLPGLFEFASKPEQLGLNLFKSCDSCAYKPALTIRLYTRQRWVTHYD